MKSLLTSCLLTTAMLAGLASGSLAGHHYHGYGMQMSEMSEIDSNDDGAITFDEFSVPTVDRLKSGFDMLDSDNDGKINKSEWDAYLKVYGFNVDSES